MAVNVLLPLLIPLGEQITNGTGNLYFTKSTYEAVVEENEAPVQLLTLKAHSNITVGTVNYRLIGGDTDGTFTTHKTTGKVTLEKPLDFETQDLYELIVGARTGQERAFARVTVKVLDVNDNAPTFARPLYETQMTEEDDRHLPKTILRVTASDQDMSDEGKLRYHLEGDGVSKPLESFSPYLHLPDKPFALPTDHTASRPGELLSSSTSRSPVDNDTTALETMATELSYFSINATTGDIQLLQPLDRDAPEGRAKWVLTIVVTDGKFDAQTTLHVNVKDINDNAPFFPDDVMVGVVSENSPAGAEVVMVRAIDLDDPKEGTHAKLTFTLEKNVIDETSGRPLFAIDRHTGRITTALCCLDREKSSLFAIQVVATDGGGLKGSGSVTVSVSDENDVGPRFKASEWRIAVHERSGVNDSLALLSVQDPDLHNAFTFRIVPDSGYGWDKFVLVPSPPNAGSLRALQPLDYEDPKQKGGFKFKVEVTDQGDDWSDPSHQDQLWAKISLIDDNDNSPRMKTTFVNISLPEDTEEGRLLSEFPAEDADENGNGKVFYSIDPTSDRKRRFRIDDKGRVRLNRRMDREEENLHALRIFASDGGSPSRTATGSLFITVTDVNDNAPFIKSPSRILLQENSPPRQLAEVYLDDPDDWLRGNGPPFKMRLDEKATTDIKRSFAVRFKSSGDSGRGLGVVSSLRPMDREEQPFRLIPVVVMDAKGLSATVTLSVILGDVNDNPMAPGRKTVNVTRIKSGSERIPLGRVFLRDPDDWDFRDKTWTWRNQFPQPFFALNRETGQISVTPDVPDDSYDLFFSVSDPTHHQHDIHANVTVRITSLGTEDEVNPSVPLLILGHTPEQLITADEKQSGSPLDALLESIQSVLDLKVKVLALEHQQREEPHSAYVPSTKEGRHNTPLLTGDGNKEGGARKPFIPAGSRWLKGSHAPTSRRPTTLWVTSKTRRPFDQLLLINRAKISEKSGVRIGDVGVGICAHFEPREERPPLHRRHMKQVLRKSSGRLMNYYSGGSWVIDANSTALVTPKVWAGVGCSCRRRNDRMTKAFPKLPSQPLQIRNSNSAVPSCHPDPCFNGGRCISSSNGPKCICPENTEGPMCKQLSRFFGVGGWAWVDPIPSCSRAHVSLEILTRNPDGVILYSGPGPDQPRGPNHPLLEEDILSLELVHGLPRLLVDLGGSHPVILHPSLNDSRKRALPQSPYQGPASLEEVARERNQASEVSENATSKSTTLADGKWHRLDVIWGINDIQMLIDLCQDTVKDCHLKGRLPLHRSLHVAENGTSNQSFAPRTPLQIGGLAYPPPKPLRQRWTDPLGHSSLDGCIKNLKINGRLVDLGRDLLSNNSTAGCPQGDFCKIIGKKCWKTRRCKTYNRASCICEPGWTGNQCHVKTLPSSFGKGSYVRVALSFLPIKQTTSVDIRFRTWSPGGQLILVTSQHSRDQFSLYMEEGHLCVLLALRSPLAKLGFSSQIVAPPLTLCLSRVTLNDGQWHDVHAIRYGRWCELRVDSGEWPLYNVSFTPTMNRLPPPQPDPENPLSVVESEFHFRRMEERVWGSHPFVIDRQEGIHIGGIPEYVGVSLLTVHQDFVHGCINDVRLNGYPLPLPPGVNTSKWAQATTFGSSVTSSCSSTPVCFNVSCPPPLICVDLWRKHQCGCGEGKVPSPDSASCQDVNECIWMPCLNGGTCNNRSPGYSCICPKGFLGDNCEMEGYLESSNSISVGIVAGVITWFSFFLVIVLAYALRQRQRRHHKSDSCRRSSSVRRSSHSSDVMCGEESLTHLECSSQSHMLELRVKEPPDINGDPAWQKQKMASTEVDVLRVDLSATYDPPAKVQTPHSSRNSLHKLQSTPKSPSSLGGVSPTAKTKRTGCGRSGGVCVRGRSSGGGGREEQDDEGDGLREKKEGPICGTILASNPDDLRYYAYEGEGSSPSSLSSCCSGQDRNGGFGSLFGGFQEVAILLNCLGNPPDTSAASGENSEAKPVTTGDPVFIKPFSSSDVTEVTHNLRREGSSKYCPTHSPPLPTSSSVCGYRHFQKLQPEGITTTSASQETTSSSSSTPGWECKSTKPMNQTPIRKKSCETYRHESPTHLCVNTSPKKPGFEPRS